MIVASTRKHRHTEQSKLNAVDLSSGKVIDTSNDLQLSSLHQLLQDGRRFELSHLVLDVFRNGRIQVPVSMVAGRFDSVVQGTNDTGDRRSGHGSVDRSTTGMSHDIQDLGPQDGASEFQGSNGFRVDNVSGNTANKHISKALIKDHLNRHATVGTGQKGGKRSLTSLEFLEAFHVAVGCHDIALDKAFVTRFQGGNGPRRSGNIHAVRLGTHLSDASRFAHR
mmetsp:Transcript_32569/g.67920  ORF Transcript_32569/g.67920 Transcript_32569/m.67920 type:complete len:223 (-) Transcript_32569:316-984(-)